MNEQFYNARRRQAASAHGDRFVTSLDRLARWCDYFPLSAYVGGSRKAGDGSVLPASKASHGAAHPRERTPVSAPIGPSTASGIETEAHRVASPGVAAVRPSLARLNFDSGVWGAAASLSPATRERRFKFRGLPAAVGAARRALRQWEDHFEPDLFYDLSLCVSELVTNTLHRGEPEDDEIELVVRHGDELVCAEVRGLQPYAVMTQSPAAADSGWGMFIVDRVADRWGVDRREGTVVWCEIDLTSDGWSRRTPPPGMTLSG